MGDHLKLQVFREKKTIDISYELNVRKPLVAILHDVDCVPSYMIVGGLVLVPLSIPFLEHAYGSSNWRKSAPVSILSLFNEYMTFKDEQVRTPVHASIIASSQLSALYMLSTVCFTEVRKCYMH